MKCRLIDASQALSGKNVSYVVECTNIGLTYNSLRELHRFVEEFFREKIAGGDKWVIEFTGNEPIGERYILFRYRSYVGGGYISIRVVARDREIRLVSAVIGRDVKDHVNISGYSSNLGDVEKRFKHGKGGDEDPPGQKYIPYFIVYRILGQPEIPRDWRLIVDGLVEKRLEYGYDELASRPLKKMISNFHCVTGWSVRDVVWEGIPLRELVEPAGVKPGARWVYVSGLDEYTAVIPIEDFLSEDSILVLKMNGEKLLPEHGYPARIFIPHLYGWKSVKWVYKISFIDKYRDGFWEALGYHPRGNIWFEERFKE